MIHIKRKKAPAFLTKKEGKWMDEIARAVQHYSDPAQTESFEFKMYNDPDLKAELEEVFFGKCAYCESPYGAVYDGDVEHFRPKLQIDMEDGKKQRPGYYWLANTWDNLLLSCMHCNQRRKHLLHGAAKKLSMGKLDQFPLADETKRAKYGSNMKAEEKVRLLLHPCIDDPEKHFEYDEREAVIQPVTKQGEASIKVYVLQRVKLVRERKNILDQLFAQMHYVKEALEDYNADPKEKNKNKLDRLLDDLLSFSNPERPYAGMCRFFTKKFLKENALG